MASEQSSEKQTRPSKEVKGWWHRTTIIPGRLDGKLAVVTGANTGIGEITVSELARRGCKVIMACRNLERAEGAKQRILTRYGVDQPNSSTVDVADASLLPFITPINADQLQIELLDLASLASVREFAQRLTTQSDQLHYLINNAGAFFQTYGTTEDGFERTIGVNHLSHFLLTELLLPLLKKATPSRIVVVSSEMHYFGALNMPMLQLSSETFSGSKAYSQSKLLNSMHAAELARRIAGSGVLVVSLHPGLVQTEIGRELHGMNRILLQTVFRPFMIRPWMGAQTTMYAVLSDKCVPGAYYQNCAIKQPKRDVLDLEKCAWLWVKSSELVGLLDKNEANSPNSPELESKSIENGHDNALG